MLHAPLRLGVSVQLADRLHTIYRREIGGYERGPFITTSPTIRFPQGTKPAF